MYHTIHSKRCRSFLLPGFLHPNVILGEPKRSKNIIAILHGVGWAPLTNTDRRAHSMRPYSNDEMIHFFQHDKL